MNNRKAEINKERFEIAKLLNFKLKEYDNSENDLLRNRYSQLSKELEDIYKETNNLNAISNYDFYQKNKIKKTIFNDRISKLTHNHRLHPSYRYIPPKVKLGVRDYRKVVGDGVYWVIRWWTGLIAPIYKQEEIIQKSYDRILETLFHLKRIKLNRSKKDAQIKKYLREYHELDKTWVSDDDWWGEKVPNEVIDEVWNSLDIIIDFVAGKIKGDVKTFLNNYLESLKKQWQK